MNNSIMSIDFNAETSLTIAEKLLEQEYVINMKRLEILSQMMIKLANRVPKIKEILTSELDDLNELEKQLSELEHTSESILS